ncbi:MAG: phosphatidylserine decarboxylase, partial [Bryobacterales bacterium]|nr:phosphatidylserine decarboxylase [Bryobacterales bacterium]
MVRDGLHYALAFTAAGCLLWWLAGVWAGVPLWAAGAFSLYFFRDPEREIPQGDVAVCPADGKVLSVVPAGPELTRISIFMNVFDVHVNRAPIGGRIVEVAHRKGRFLIASRDRAALENEQNSVVIESEGTRVLFRQIAGLIARRIVFYKKPGDFVTKGERVGLIKFGSRVDVFLGPEWEPTVRAGQRVKA